MAAGLGCWLSSGSGPKCCVRVHGGLCSSNVPKMDFFEFRRVGAPHSFVLLSTRQQKAPVGKRSILAQDDRRAKRQKTAVVPAHNTFRSAHR
jgi:hypothetical protein